MPRYSVKMFEGTGARRKQLADTHVDADSKAHAEAIVAGQANGKAFEVQDLPSVAEQRRADRDARAKRNKRRR